MARVFFLIPMVRGFSAIRELDQPRRVRPSSPGRPAAASSPPVASTPIASAVVPARRLSGEAGKRRLQMTERIGVRQLPPDPPGDSGVILDLVAYVGGRWEPARVFGTRIVNYGALSGGASTARLENLRRFARHVSERHPAVAVDEETLGFLESQKAPARSVNMTQFTEYDALYG